MTLWTVTGGVGASRGFLRLLSRLGREVLEVTSLQQNYGCPLEFPGRPGNSTRAPVAEGWLRDTAACLEGFQLKPARPLLRSA